MRILVIRNLNPFYESSASANRWRTLLQGLADNGANITIIAIGGYNSWLEIKKTFTADWNSSVKVHHTFLSLADSLFFRRVNRYVLSPLFRYYNLLYIKIFIKLFKPDIIWTNASNPEETFLLKRLLQSRKYKTMLELSEFDDLQPIVKNHFLKRYLNGRFNDMRNFILPHVDIFNIMTLRLLEHYKELSGGNKFYIHTPMTVDLSRFDLSQKQVHMNNNTLHKPYIMFCGAISNQKDGVDILIQAFAVITRKYPQYFLYIVGPRTHDSAFLDQLVEKLGLASKVIFTGAVDRDRIPGMLFSADILALARPLSHQADGGFPTKLGEYLATGNPVCVTTTGEIAEYLTDGESAFLAEPGNPESFAEALERVLADYDYARKIGQNGRLVAEKSFNMNLQAKKLYNALEHYLVQPYEILH